MRGCLVVYVGGLGCRNRFGNHQPDHQLRSQERSRWEITVRRSLCHSGHTESYFDLSFLVISIGVFFCIVKVPVLFYQQLNKRNRKEDGMDAKNPPFQLFQRRFASNFFFLGDAGFNDWGDQLRFTAGSGWGCQPSKTGWFGLICFSCAPNRWLSVNQLFFFLGGGEFI